MIEIRDAYKKAKLEAKNFSLLEIGDTGDMLILKLNSETEKNVVYNYYPEGKGIYGKVSIDKMTGDIESKAAKNDKFDRYLMHAIKRIREYYGSGKYKNSDMVAWY